MYYYLLIFPLRGVVMIYNLPGLGSRLVLSRDHLVGIYNGTIVWWNDTSLQELNPTVSLPGKQIRPVARADYAGTTEIFTHALSIFNEDWNVTYGTFAEGLNQHDNPVKWDPEVVSLYGRTTHGMSGIVFSYRYSVGYITVAEALAANWTYAKLVNIAGNVVDVDPEVTGKVIVDRVGELSQQLTGSLVDSERPDAYPLLGYSYLIVRMTQMSNCDSATELLWFVEWLFEDKFARELAHEMLMAYIPDEVSEIVDPYSALTVRFIKVN